MTCEFFILRKLQQNLQLRKFELFVNLLLVNELSTQPIFLISIYFVCQTQIKIWNLFLIPNTSSKPFDSLINFFLPKNSTLFNTKLNSAHYKQIILLYVVDPVEATTPIITPGILLQITYAIKINKIAYLITGILTIQFFFFKKSLSNLIFSCLQKLSKNNSIIQ